MLNRPGDHSQMLRALTVCSAVIVVASCGAREPHRVHGFDPYRFGYWNDPRPGELSVASLTGKFCHAFPAGTSILELDPPSDRYKLIIRWRSGVRYATDWRRMRLVGLRTAEPSILFWDLPRELACQRHRPKSTEERFPTQPLARELSPEECASYPTGDCSSRPIRLNWHREPVVLIAIGPEEWFAKLPD